MERDQSMKRALYAFVLLFSLLLGLGAGLAYSWLISPRALNGASPALLRADFKDQFRSLIAASYAASGNLPRAQARLRLLGEDDPAAALNAQAQRSAARGDFAEANHLAALALALQGSAPPLVTIPTETATQPPLQAAPSAFPSPSAAEFFLTETATPLQVELPSPAPSATPRPTRTPPPTQGAPFRLIGQDTVCNPTLPQGLLQIIVLNASRRQLPGIKIIITWDTGGEEIFTGLKPELGNGYADFVMSAGVAHAVQLAPGSEIATNLVPPLCQTESGDTYLGGYKLTFQQP
jgi:hypothetical protein